MSTSGDAPILRYEPPAIDERTPIAALAVTANSDTLNDARN